MPNTRQPPTNAADSTPGVEDGAGPGMVPASKTAAPGRKVVWVVVALALLALLAIFIINPINAGEPPGGRTAGVSTPVNPAAPPETL